MLHTYKNRLNAISGLAQVIGTDLPETEPCPIRKLSNNLKHVSSCSHDQLVRSSESEMERIGVTNAAPSVGSVHDSMRHGLHNIATQVNGRHPFEERLRNARQKEEEMMMKGHRLAFGLHEVVRREIEKDIVRHDFVPFEVGGPSNLHFDILTGRDTTIDVEDIYPGTEFASMTFHQQVDYEERKKQLDLQDTK